MYNSHNGIGSKLTGYISLHFDIMSLVFHYVLVSWFSKLIASSAQEQDSLAYILRVKTECKLHKYI